MRQVIYTFGSFETTSYELAEKMKHEKGMQYGVRLENIEEVSEHVKKIRRLRGLE